MRPLLFSSLFYSVSLAMLAQPRTVFAADKKACLEAVDVGQKLRDDGKFRAAKDAFLVCSSRACPSAVSAQCTEWLSELERDTPSVMFRVSDRAGKELLEAQLTLDAEASAFSVSAKPMHLDPGTHTVKVALSDGRFSEEKFLLRKGERDRIVSIQIASAPSTAAKSENSVPETSVKKPSPAETTTTASGSGFVFPTLGWVGASVFVLGGAGALGFGLSAKSAENEERAKGCAPYCDPSGRSAIETKLLLGNLSLVLAAAGLGLAVVSTVIVNAQTEGAKKGGSATWQLIPSLALMPKSATLGCSGSF
jgi:hypothetical protein